MSKWIGTILVLLLIVALVTAPSVTKFEKFAEGKVNTSACKPFITYDGYKLFSICTVSECKKVNKVYNPQTGQYSNMSIGLPSYGKKQKYLGLFGKFWKL